MHQQVGGEPHVARHPGWGASWPPCPSLWGPGFVLLGLVPPMQSRAQSFVRQSLVQVPAPLVLVFAALLAFVALLLVWRGLV